MSSERCAACDASDVVPSPLGAGIVRCSRCSLERRSPLPDAALVAGLYSARAYFQGGSDYADYLGEEPEARANFARRLADLRRVKPGGRLFEIGAAYGFFLDLARAHFDVRGIELCAEAAAHARAAYGLDVACADATALGAEPASYDVVCMWDTIEHLREPDRVVAAAAHALRPGGLLCVTTGDAGSLVARLRGQRWRLVQPTHLYYFSRPTLRRLLERTGFEEIAFSHCGFRRTVRQAAHRIALRWPARSVAARTLESLASSPLGRAGFYLNLFDIMFVIARRRP